MLNGLKLGFGALVAGALLALAAPAYAECDTNHSCKGSIDLLYPSPADDQVYIALGGGLDGLRCAPPGGKYFVMALNTDTKRATWQLLVAAFLSGKPVKVVLNATLSQCIIQYVTVGP